MSVCSFMGLLDRSPEVAVLFIASVALPQVDNVSRLAIKLSRYFESHVVDHSYIVCTNQWTLEAVGCSTFLGV